MFALLETASVLPSVCLHCKAEPANRRRGLGRRCYDDLAVREQYEQIRPTHNAGAVRDSDAVVAAVKIPPPSDDHEPGSAERKKTLRSRAKAGLPLFGRGDVGGGVYARRKGVGDD